MKMAKLSKWMYMRIIADMLPLKWDDMFSPTNVPHKRITPTKSTMRREIHKLCLKAPYSSLPEGGDMIWKKNQLMWRS